MDGSLEELMSVIQNNIATVCVDVHPCPTTTCLILLTDT